MNARCTKRSHEVVVVQESPERDGVTYDLACPESPLIVRMVSASARWRVEARTSEARDAIVVMACGSTRAEALAEVGRWWTRQEIPLALPHLDWDAVTRALAEVRAV